MTSIRSAALLILFAASGPVSAARISPALALKNYALTACIAKGLGSGPASQKAAAAAREYLEHGGLPIEAYTEAVKLSSSFLAKPYSNIKGEDLIFIKCLELYNSDALSNIVRKYSRKPR